MPELTDEDYDDYDQDDPDDDWDDDDDYREPDPEDYEIAKAYEEYAEHCEEKHGGGECDCRPPLRARLAASLRRAGRRITVWRRSRRYSDEPPF